MVKFSSICLITKDVHRLVRFYEMIFSTTASGDDTHAELICHGLHIAIFSWTGMEQMAQGSMCGAGTGCFTLSFELDDVDAEFERLKELKIQFVKLPQTHPWGSRSFWFRDPDGNIINFFTQIHPQTLHD